MGSSPNEEILREVLELDLKNAGSKLLKPPSSTEELLILLEEVERLLRDVFQQPPKSTEDALVPAMKALVVDEVLRHADVNVQVAVASCINELTRISAPLPPYDDDKMKEAFRLFMVALKHLSSESGSNYIRALQILKTMSMVRSFLIMMDIDSDATLAEMFQIFFNTMRCICNKEHKHFSLIFKYMEDIMRLAIEESDEVSLELLRPLLDSVHMDNKHTSPILWVLGRSVFKHCANKIQPYLRDAVKAMNLKIEDYAAIVTSLCKDTSNGNSAVVEDILEKENEKDKELFLETLKCCKQALQTQNISATSDADEVNNAETNAIRNDTVQSEANVENVIDEATCTETVELEGNTRPDLKEPDNAEDLKSDTDIGTRRGKRSRRKPNSLMRPEEGYQHTWISQRKVSFKLSCDRNNRDEYDMKIDSAQKESDSVDEGSIKRRTLSKKKQSIISEHKKKKKESMLCQNDDEESLSKILREIVQSKASERGSNSLKKTAKKLRTKNETVDVENEMVESLKTMPAKKKPRGNLATAKKLLTKNEAGNVEDEMVESRMSNTKPGKKKPCGSLSVEKEKMAGKSDVEYQEDLVNAKIMVWWPIDETFYTGTVESFDPLTKKHKIKYDDDEEELLNLKEEKWELFSNRPTEKIQASQRRQSDRPSPAKDEHVKTHQTASKRKPGTSRKQRKPTSSKRSKTEGPV